MTGVHEFRCELLKIEQQIEKSQGIQVTEIGERLRTWVSRVLRIRAEGDESFLDAEPPSDDGSIPWTTAKLEQLVFGTGATSSATDREKTKDWTSQNGVTGTGKRDAEAESRARATHPFVSDDALRLAARLCAGRTSSDSVILFTGVSGMDNVSELSIHAAAALAQTAGPALLVDANLREPSYHDVLEVPRSPGFVQLLRRAVEPSDVIHPSPVPHLSVLPAGFLGADELPALWNASDSDHLIESLRGRFSFVIINAPPVLEFVDSTFLATYTDGVVLVIASGRRRSQVVEAKRLLDGVKASLVGVVLNERKRVSRTRGSTAKDRQAPR